MLYFSTSIGCCASPTLVNIVIFSIFCAKELKKWKKVTILVQNLAKKRVFFIIVQGSRN